MFFRTTRIYADAAAGTPIRKEVRARLVELLPLFGNPGALHFEARAAQEALRESRKEVATALGVHADEIVFTASGTEGNNLALRGVLEGGSPGHLIVLAIEHPSVLAVAEHLQTKGHRVTKIPVSPEGVANLEVLAEALRLPGPTLVSIQYANSEVGVVQDVRAIAKVIRAARKEGGDPIYLHSDASQAPLWLDVHVPHLGVDLLTLDGQKIGGPKGVGALYVRRGIELVPQTLGGGQESGRRSGTENTPLIGAFARALSLAVSEREAVVLRVRTLRDTLAERLKQAIPEAVIHTAPLQLPNLLSVRIPHLLGDMAAIALSARGVSVSTRSACSTDEEEASHVLLAVGMSPKEAQETTRISLLPTVTQKDVLRIVDAYAHVWHRYRDS